MYRHGRREESEVQSEYRHGNCSYWRETASVRAILEAFESRTFPNTLRSSPPSSSRTTGTPRASYVQGPRARAARRASSGCGSGSPPVLPRAAPPAQLLWLRPPRASGPARSSKRDVPVLARRAFGALGPDHGECLYEVRARLARVYHVVDVAHLGGDHRVVELLLI